MKMNKTEVLAALAGLFFVLVATFIGVFAIPFAGTGPVGLPKTISVLLGIELPVFIVFFFISRRALMIVCWMMFAADAVFEILFNVTESGFSLSALHLFLGIVPWINLTGILVPLSATYLYREEMRRLDG
jgi:hypothetical protein